MKFRPLFYSCLRYCPFKSCIVLFRVAPVIRIGVLKERESMKKVKAVESRGPYLF